MIAEVPFGRKVELAQRFPLGATFVMTDPWPVRGEIVAQDERGIRVATEHGYALLPWRTLNGTRESV